MPAVGATEQGRIVESHAAIRLHFDALAQRFEGDCLRGSAAAEVINERWNAGHRGHYKANHVFANTVGGDLISEGGTGAQILQESRGVTYLNSCITMVMTVRFFVGTTNSVRIT